MKLGSIVALVCMSAVSGGLFGCSSGNSSDGVKPEDKAQLIDANALAKKVNGDYDKLSQSEKEVILKMANGNDAQARTLCKMMAHPPNEANAGRGAGGQPSAK